MGISAHTYASVRLQGFICSGFGKGVLAGNPLSFLTARQPQPSSYSCTDGLTACCLWLVLVTWSRS